MVEQVLATYVILHHLALAEHLLAVIQALNLQVVEVVIRVIIVILTLVLNMIGSALVLEVVLVVVMVSVDMQTSQPHIMPMLSKHLPPEAVVLQTICLIIVQV